MCSLYCCSSSATSQPISRKPVSVILSNVPPRDGVSSKVTSNELPSAATSSAGCVQRNENVSGGRASTTVNGTTVPPALRSPNTMCPADPGVGSYCASSGHHSLRWSGLLTTSKTTVGEASTKISRVMAPSSMSLSCNVWLHVTLAGSPAKRNYWLQVLFVQPSGGEDGGAQHNSVVEEVRDDRPPEPPMLLEGPRGPVAERHRHDQADAVIGVVRRPQREAESKRRPRPPAELGEPGHHEAVDDDLFVDRGRRRDDDRVDDEVRRNMRVVLLVGERVVVEDAGQR